MDIRDIASVAGVSHGLVQRYCGTREQMIAEIVRQEVEGATTPFVPGSLQSEPDGPVRNDVLVDGARPAERTSSDVLMLMQ